MGILAFILEGLAFASLDLGIDAIKNLNKGQGDKTKVELVIGSGTEEARIGGMTPAIALWNERGERVGQHNAVGKKGDGDSANYDIEHNQGHDGPSQAAYLMMSNIDDDAICISAIYVTDDRVSTAIFGDLPKMCGISWTHSNRAIGETHQMPDCFWLDNDGTNGINAQAISFHLPDAVANPDRIAQYNEKQDSFCKSSPRFSFWGDLLPDSLIPIFNPALEYEKDSENAGVGRDKDIDRVLDKETVDKSVSMLLDHHTMKREAGNDTTYLPGGGIAAIPNFLVKKRDAEGARPRRKRADMHRDRLVVTPYKKHSAIELCNSETSWGPDEVSLTERMFCDMDTKTLYPLCDDQTTNNCFDLDAETLVLPDGNVAQDGVQVHARGVPAPKKYKTTNYW